MEKSKLINWCVDSICLSAVAVVFLYILSDWNNGITEHTLRFYDMSRNSVNNWVGLFILCISSIYWYIKKKNRKFNIITSVINGIIAFFATAFYTVAENYLYGSDRYSFFLKKNILYYFLILFVSFMIVRYQLRRGCVKTP